MKKNVYLHLGTYKTGTSYLQSIFGNCLKGVVSNLLYPETGVYNFAHHYAASPRFPGWSGGQGKEAFLKILHSLNEEIRNASEEKILISSEMFCSQSRDVVEIIARALGEHRLCGILYLRTPDEFHESLAAQLIKGCNGPVEAQQNIGHAMRWVKGQKPFDYSVIYENWRDFLGEDNLKIRPYDKRQFIDGDLLEDFCQEGLGIKKPDFPKSSATNINPSLTLSALQFKMLINRLPLERDLKNEIIPLLLEFSRQESCRTLQNDQLHFERHDTDISKKQRMAEKEVLLGDCRIRWTLTKQKYTDAELSDIMIPWQKMSVIVETAVTNNPAWVKTVLSQCKGHAIKDQAAQCLIEIMRTIAARKASMFGFLARYNAVKRKIAKRIR